MALVPEAILEKLEPMADRESVVLLKLLNTISVAPSNIQLDMLEQ